MQSLNKREWLCLIRNIAKGLAIGVVIAILAILGLMLWVDDRDARITASSDIQVPSAGNAVENGSRLDIPSIGTGPGYGKDFKTYTSRSGFSFKYPSHLEVMDLLSHIVLSPADEDGDSGRIVISIGFNDENMTAEEWFLSPDSGYLQSKDSYGNYYKTTIDGQNAVYTDGGMWMVVNTPDDKFRLSIADLPSKNNDRLFTEMSIVIESLVFSR